MKTLRLALLATALAGSAVVLTAGPGPQFWARPAAAKTPAVTATPAPAATCVTCACCKKG